MDTVDLSAITPPSDHTNMAFVEFMVIASSQVATDAVTELDGMLDLLPPASPARAMLVALVGAIMRNHEVVALGLLAQQDAAIAAAAAADAERARLGTAKPIMAAGLPEDDLGASGGPEIAAGVDVDAPGIPAVAVPAPAPVSPADREAFAAPIQRSPLNRGRGRR